MSPDKSTPPAGTLPRPIRFIQQVRLIDHKELDDFLKLGLKTGDGSEFFKIGIFKLLPDGSLGGKTAALREGYVGDEENLYTTGSAYTAYEEGYKGKLKKGCLADFAVLSDDLFGASEDKLLAVRVDETYVGGEAVYRR